MRFRLSRNNNSGIILIVVLWIVAVLAVVAIGLGRAASIDLGLAKHRIGKLKADFLLWGAFNYAMNQIRLRGMDQSSAEDTLYQCGFDLKDGVTSKDLFEKVPLKDGSFDISYVLKNDNGQGQVCYGFQDEERRINVNAIADDNYKILVNLFDLLNIDEDTAERIAAEIVDWQDADSQVTNAPYGAEKDDYQALAKPYASKDLPFESIEELLLLKDVTPQIFAKIKDYLTVIPNNNLLSLNVNTAPEIVLKAFFRFIVQYQRPDEWSMDTADSLAEKIVSYRNGKDRMPCTDDDQAIRNINIGELKLLANENALYFTAANYFQHSSKYFRVCATATDSQYRVSSKAEAVISRENLSFLLWKRK